jgi:alkylation response protein AidB-like acyl-CoA dehydrogenase
MLALCEMNNSHLAYVSNLMDKGETTIGMIGRAKAMVSKNAREVTSLAREICGGNGIILDYNVMKHFMDIEGIYTYEGTYDINMLVSGRELTGGLKAIK